MVIEAFDGLGTSEAMIQARSVSRLQLDTLFWIHPWRFRDSGWTYLARGSSGREVLRRSGYGGVFYRHRGQQPLVGAAVIPSALLNRQLKYERLAAVGVLATLAAAVTRLGLAIGGAGAWALVGRSRPAGFIY